MILVMYHTIILNTVPAFIKSYPPPLILYINKEGIKYYSLININLNI